MLLTKSLDISAVSLQIDLQSLYNSRKNSIIEYVTNLIEEFDDIDIEYYEDDEFTDLMTLCHKHSKRYIFLYFLFQDENELIYDLVCASEDDSIDVIVKNLEDIKEIINKYLRHENKKRVRK